MGKTKHHHHANHDAARDVPAPTLTIVGGPATHEVRHHGRLITHLSEQDAHAYVEHKIATAGLEEQHEAKREHDEAWDIRPRRPVELHYRGNLVDTFDDAEEAHAAKEEHDEATQAEASMLGRVADPDAPPPAPHIAHRLVDAPKPIPVLDTDNPVKDPRTGEISFPQVIDPATGRPKMHTPKIVQAYEVAHDTSDPYTIVDRSAAAAATAHVERGRARG